MCDRKLQNSRYVIWCSFIEIDLWVMFRLYWIFTSTSVHKPFKTTNTSIRHTYILLNLFVHSKIPKLSNSFFLLILALKCRWCERFNECNDSWCVYVFVCYQLKIELKIELNKLNYSIQLKLTHVYKTSRIRTYVILFDTNA